MTSRIVLACAIVTMIVLSSVALASARNPAPTATIGATAAPLAAAGDPAAGVTVMESSSLSYQFPARSFNVGSSFTEPDYAGSGGASGKATLTSFTLTKTFDQDTVRLQKALLSGKHIQKVTIALGTGGSFVLSDVVVTNLRTGGSGGAAPVDTFTLSYAKLREAKDGLVTCFSQVTFSTAC